MKNDIHSVDVIASKIDDFYICHPSASWDLVFVFSGSQLALG